MNSAVLILLAALSGCAGGATDERPAAGPLGADFGNAVRHNAAVQIVDPEPMNLDGSPPPMDGRRAAAAMGRYQSGDVEIPEAVSTSGEQND